MMFDVRYIPGTSAAKPYCLSTLSRNINIMYFPRDVQPAASPEWCSNWDKIFHPHKNCPKPTSTTAYSSAPSASTTPAYDPRPDHGPDPITMVIIFVGAFIGLAAIIAVISSIAKASIQKRRLREQARNSHRVRSQPQPTLKSKLSSWWNRQKSGRRSRSRDVEMGRFKRGLSRVRSIAKSNPELSNVPPVGVQPPASDPNTPQRLRRSGEAVVRSQGVEVEPRRNPPQYENTPISDQFMSAAERGVEETVATPPPTYNQRAGDRYFWEDDGTPAPGYTPFLRREARPRD
ncbi:uncharacterized protein LY89DRAFT_723737 [Mollisia scopiformis]|uniref:Transmembrane protein n=1 Tax=Mollisia scopiformis TaxID=149040 RepID=A0A132BFS4_MOLSC|nr:uncharacterized protein LY89DRAFT_723737 [Mollisia scopiformis]KUJ10567.1 hypothetical protein LY89DRAFT_723737 [Mollisia scopiformis]